ncbi:DUF3019 domain-containing protein [Aliikangiella sp. IMCC44359]|uniref:DUF3019 domain-containing protein n=1 Tax=Aliikangiella sp. IMCC44359 TaxID=3459125 RepID=UPI00403B1ADB
MEWIKRTILTCFTIGLAFDIYANPINKNEYGLFLSPNLCLLSKSEPTCEIKLHIHWQTKQLSNYCLHQSNSEPAIKCWDNSNSAEYDISLNLENNLTLYLIDEITDKTIYQQTVRLQRQTTPYRQRRRNPWRFY